MEGKKRRITMIVIRKIPTMSDILSTFNQVGLISRANKSILSQTYQIFKIIIIANHNIDEMIRKLNVDWLLYCNLTERGKYPTNQRDR